MRRRILGMVLLATGAVLTFLLYRSTFLSMWIAWKQSGYWQLFIPALSGYMIASRRKDIAGVANGYAPSAGFVLVLAGMALYFAGYITIRDLPTEMSLYPFLLGVAFLLFGARASLLLAVPILYLSLLSPVFASRPTGFLLSLQVWSAQIATALLNFFGFIALRESHLIRLPAVTLNVVEWCSGFNQLLSMSALAVPIAYTSFRRLGPQALLVLISFPAAVVFNGIRIAMIGMFAYNTPRENVHGPLDVFRMPFVLVVGVGFLFLVSWTLAKVFREEHRPNKALEEVDRGGFWTRGRIYGLLGLCVILLAANGAPLYFLISGRVGSPVSISTPEGLVTADLSMVGLYRDERWNSVVRTISPGREIFAVSPDTTRLYAALFHDQQPSNKVLLKLVPGRPHPVDLMCKGDSGRIGNLNTFRVPWEDGNGYDVVIQGYIGEDLVTGDPTEFRRYLLKRTVTLQSRWGVQFVAVASVTVSEAARGSLGEVADSSPGAHVILKRAENVSSPESRTFDRLTSVTCRFVNRTLETGGKADGQWE